MLWPRPLMFLMFGHTEWSLCYQFWLGHVYLDGVMAPKSCFAHIWSCSELDLWHLGLTFSEKAIYSTNLSFYGQKFKPGTCWWWDGPTSVLVHILVMLWSWPLSLIFSKMLSFSLTKSDIWHIQMEFWLKSYIPDYMLWYWLLSVKIFGNTVLDLAREIFTS